MYTHHNYMYLKCFAGIHLHKCHFPIQDWVYGVAFEIREEEEEHVRRHLDHREKGGYTLQRVTFYPDDKSEDEHELELYIGTADNPNYLGPASTDDIAQQIYHSVGPSGRNIDYLLNLAKALRKEIPGVDDPHIFELEQKVLCLQAKTDGYHI